MTSRNSFVRKIGYGVAIGVLMFPLYWLSSPATSDVTGDRGSPGGVLARLRDQHHLSPADLGQIDPTSVTIKLATLGMRGVAAIMLWEKANDYFVKKDWTKRAAVLNQITKIQPNFINVWLNQAWNVSYNISVQFDDYRERYRWVVKGFDFLKQGIQYNDRQPTLQWQLGMMITHKIGTADEKKQYRKLFKEDNDFHGTRPLAERDNWLVGKESYEEAVKIVDEHNARIYGKNPLIYRSSGPMCLMSYGEALEKDGTFGEVAKAAWTAAAREWKVYGDKDLESSFRDPADKKPLAIHLNDEEMLLQKAKKLAEQLDAIEPGRREKLRADKMAALTAAQREALETPAEKRTGWQTGLAQEATDAVNVTHDQVARSIRGPQREEAVKLAAEANRCEQIAEYINRQREIVNFVYWRTRAQVEQSDEMLAARKEIFQGDRAFADPDLIAARDAYNRGFQHWRTVLNQHPELLKDSLTVEDVKDLIKHYREILGQCSEPFPKDFILQDALDAIPGQPPAEAKDETEGQGRPAEPKAEPAAPAAAK